jgi:hypothetical protein
MNKEDYLVLQLQLRFRDRGNGWTYGKATRNKLQMLAGRWRLSERTLLKIQTLINRITFAHVQGINIVYMCLECVATVCQWFYAISLRLRYDWLSSFVRRCTIWAAGLSATVHVNWWNKQRTELWYGWTCNQNTWGRRTDICITLFGHCSLALYQQQLCLCSGCQISIKNYKGVWCIWISMQSCAPCNSCLTGQRVRKGPTTKVLGSNPRDCFWVGAWNTLGSLIERAGRSLSPAGGNIVNRKDTGEWECKLRKAWTEAKTNRDAANLYIGL